MTTPRRGRSLLDRPAEAADLREAAERRRAMRAMLARPLLHGTGPQSTEQTSDDLRLVRRHREVISKEFADGLRYRLIVEPGGARLVKAGLGRDCTRPLRRPSRGGTPGRPFSPRGYALLMISLAVLSRSRQQLLLGELAGEIRSAAATVGIALDLESITDRRALQAVLLVLAEFGILTERDGDLEHWAESGTAQSLLDVSAERMSLLLAVPLPIGRSDAEILEPPPLTSAAGGARIAARRILAESPVLTTEELHPEHQEWWARNRGVQIDWFDRVLGLRLELRAEGALTTDPDEELTDETFPGSGTVRHAALLVLTTLVAGIRARTRAETSRPAAWWPVSAAELRTAVDAVLAEHAPAFRKDFRTDPIGLSAEVTDLLGRMGLLRRDAGNWLLHAASARYAAQVSRRSAVTDTPSLFDRDERKPGVQPPSLFDRDEPTPDAPGQTPIREDQQ